MKLKIHLRCTASYTATYDYVAIEMQLQDTLGQLGTAAIEDTAHTSLQVGATAIKDTPTVQSAPETYAKLKLRLMQLQHACPPLDWKMQLQHTSPPRH